MVFVVVSIMCKDCFSQGEAQGAWKLHPSNFVTQELFISLPNLALVLNFGSGVLHFISG